MRIRIFMNRIEWQSVIQTGISFIYQVLLEQLILGFLYWFA